MTCAFLLSCLPGGAVLYSGSKPSWGQPRTLRPCLRGDSSAPSVRRRMCGLSCFGTDKERRRGSCRGGAFTKNGEGRGTAGNRSLRMGEGARMGCAAAFGAGPLRCRAALCARFPLTIPHGAEKSNLFVCCRTLLCAFTAVECIFYALLTVESLTFSRILPIIKIWKKNRTTWRPSSARTSCA